MLPLVSSSQQFTVLQDAVLEVGDNALFNDGVVLCAAKSIKIGSPVKVADMVYIYDTHFHQVCPDEPLTEASVSIGNNVWIGANSMDSGRRFYRRPQCHCGRIDCHRRNSPGSLAGGIPARVIKTFGSA